MSYCRFSSDDFKCDVYVYESDFGFEIIVARSRIIFDEELPLEVDFRDTENYVKRHNKVMKIIENSGREPIGLPHDGESFLDDTALSCANRLIELRNIGYRVPQYAIDALMEESNG